MARAPRLLLALLLSAPAPALVACSGGGPKLARVEAPAEGLQLRYDLTPGQVYKGSVRHSAAIRSVNSSSSVNNHFSFDLTLTVRGPDQAHGGTAVTARFSGVTVRWTLPPSSPFSPSEFNRRASEQLNSLEVDYSVDETGKIVHMPDLPDEITGELRGLLQEALDSLETAFLPVPATALKVGDTWKDEKKRGREGKLGRFVKGTTQSRLEGLYRTGEPPLVVAKILIDEDETEVTTTSAGSHEVKKGGNVEALFATDQKYLVSYVADRRTDDTGKTTTFEKTEVSWQKTPSQTAPAATAQVQDISDPCHPDYVGAEECPAEGAQPPADQPPADQPPASSQPPATATPPPSPAPAK